MNNDPDVIPINYPIPSELQAMMVDYKSIVNHLLSFGIHHKIGMERHYYPIAVGDDSGKPKPIPPFRELRDGNMAWFREYYGNYPVHYLGAASSFAMQLIKSWRTLGGDITAIPHLRKPIARLDNDLYTIKKIDNKLQIEIKTAPRKSVVIETNVTHRHWNAWSQNRNGALVIVPDGLRLCFTDDADVPKAKASVAYDFNFERVVLARSDGEIKEVDLKDVMLIQKRHRTKRISVQRTMSHNPVKGERLNTKNSGREHRRVEDLLHKKIHGKNNDILSFVGDRHLGVEDLHRTTQDILKDDHGTKHNVRMSSWIHGAFESIISHHHPDSSLYYTRGTSRYCPFCSSTLTHPTWKQSRCKTHGLFDRDWLEAVSGLVRTNSKHKKGQPWATVNTVFPEPIEAKLLHNSLLSNSSMMIRGLSPEMESVHPECAILFPEARSDIGIIHSDTVMHENRSDVDKLMIVGSAMTESGNDANFEVDKHRYVCL